MPNVVLDASAVLAYLRRERGADKAAEWLDGAVISAVNWAEVIQKLVDDGMVDDTIELALSSLSPTVIDFDAAFAKAAGRLRRTTRRGGLSLGDRACVALGQQLGLPVLTADRAWAELDLGVEVVLIR